MLGLERMKSYAPIDAVDPILCIFADCELNKSTMTILLSHYDVLKKYAQAIFAKSDNNGAFDSLELPNHNQFMLFIRERYTQALDSAKHFEQLGENCRPQNTQVFKNHYFKFKFLFSINDWLLLFVISSTMLNVFVTISTLTF